MIVKRKHGGARAGAGRRPGPPTRAVWLPVPLADLARQMAAVKRGGEVAAFIDVEARSALRVPMMALSAAAGFPSPAGWRRSASTRRSI